MRCRGLEGSHDGKSKRAVSTATTERLSESLLKHDLSEAIMRFKTTA
jgi:hypothetical protein